VFTAAAHGNVSLGAALLPVNLVVQLALLPVFVVALTGAAADIPVADLVASVALVLGIPVGIALAARSGAGLIGATDRLDRLLDRLQPASLALLAVAVAAIFATHAQVVIDQPTVLLRLLVPLLAFFAVAYLAATAAARVGRFGHRERVTLTMTTMARNSPIALAVATAAFPDRPLIALALVVGPLVELPVLSVTAHRLRGR
jgi:arsenite transporter